MDDFGAWLAPFDYYQQPGFLTNLQGVEDFRIEELPFQFSVPDVTTSVEETAYNTPTSTASLPNSSVDSPRNNKRRQSSSPSESGSLLLARKTRRLRDPEQTAKVREKGACYSCQLRRKECQDGWDPEGACLRCFENAKSVTIIPGLLRPLCWRPNAGDAEVIRRGPATNALPFLRGRCEDEGPGKQALWKQFATRRSGNEATKSVELSQNWTSKVLRIPLERYKPKEGDKQYHAWFDSEGEHRYQTPPYGIANVPLAKASIRRFLEENSDAYIEAHMRGASEITRQTFQATRANKHHLPLVERALKLWVCCRFIERPWSIVGAERLGMTMDPDPNSPYHDRIPIPPMVDLQIDLIVINELLRPELKIILKMIKTMLESSKPWMNWLEIYLAYFILLHNVELTTAHDLWFAKRNNLKSKYSNKVLIDVITQGATTLLTCFHYAHQGYAPFSNPELDNTQNWTSAEKDYLSTMRPLISGLGGDHVGDPAKELFWTTQLLKPDWRPVVLMC